MSAPGQGLPTTCEVYDLGDSSWVALPPCSDAAMGTPHSPPAAATAPAAPPAASGASSRGPPTATRRRRTPDNVRPEDFPLNLKRVLQSPSEDFPLIKRVLHARLTTYHWKKFVWLLRARQAAYQEGAPLRRRPVRWLATLLAKEVGLI